MADYTIGEAMYRRRLFEGEPGTEFSTPAQRQARRRRKALYGNLGREAAGLGPTAEVGAEGAPAGAGPETGVMGSFLRRQRPAAAEPERERVSLLSLEGRRRHPVASSVVAASIYGARAGEHFQGLERGEEAKQQRLAQQAAITERERQRQERQDLRADKARTAADIRAARTAALSNLSENMVDPEDPLGEIIKQTIRAERKRQIEVPEDLKGRFREVGGKIREVKPEKAPGPSYAEGSTPYPGYVSIGGKVRPDRTFMPATADLNRVLLQLRNLEKDMAKSERTIAAYEQDPEYAGDALVKERERLKRLTDMRDEIGARADLLTEEVKQPSPYTLEEYEFLKPEQRYEHDAQYQKPKRRGWQAAGGD